MEVIAERLILPYLILAGALFEGNPVKIYHNEAIRNNSPASVPALSCIEYCLWFVLAEHHS